MSQLAGLSNDQARTIRDLLLRHPDAGRTEGFECCKGLDEEDLLALDDRDLRDFIRRMVADFLFAPLVHLAVKRAADAAFEGRIKDSEKALRRFFKELDTRLDARPELLSVEYVLLMPGRGASQARAELRKVYEHAFQTLVAGRGPDRDAVREGIVDVGYDGLRLWLATRRMDRVASLELGNTLAAGMHDLLGSRSVENVARQLDVVEQKLPGIVRNARIPFVPVRLGRVLGFGHRLLMQVADDDS